ncbi:hypothetical protein PQ455_19405 (plasmid) [Sphingomonas naphthae]|uniref:Uncharacterized protein n=1 Tax=Sphingomonas naphthae TaxID=1813468 RepID=A0ABY7TR54_9SPHN|nr:hypothetical protein [Sphingomonas naphthae]WCT75707.1 hypothetical protein PQ455_19405 [Sphingomonas naphthae]
MLKTRMRRLVAQNDDAAARLRKIALSITNLIDEDLLDLADIFKASPASPLGEMARSEMAKRNIKL